VFEASPYQNNWDGQATKSLYGKDLQEDTYFYFFKADANSEAISSYIELIRD
jgi:hypothetical protein